MSSYLPMMVDIRNKKILLVGGGALAREKLGRIYDLACEIRVVSLNFEGKTLELIKQRNIPYEQREYLASDLDEADMVIVAVSDSATQERIFNEASKKNKLCNAIDLQRYCHFIFPSIIRRGDLIVSISTLGASPATAKHLKQLIDKLIPNSIVDFLTQMRAKKAAMPKNDESLKELDRTAKEYVEQLERDIVADFAARNIS